MTIDKDTAIERATESIRVIDPHALFVSANETDKLREFKGRRGWRIYFHIDDKDFGPYDRPIEVDGETGEAKVVEILL
ncbi:MAG: hypothetical protein JNK76_17725 [Planctomycetales bacterium]|nr:hypothetical protein [Planctomycetales bacterium]